MEKELNEQRTKTLDISEELRQLKDKYHALEIDTQKQSEQFRIEKLKLVDHNRSLQSDFETCTDSLDECLTREEKLKADNAALQAQLDESNETSKLATEELEQRRREITALKKKCKDLELELEDTQFELDNAQFNGTAGGAGNRSQFRGDAHGVNTGDGDVFAASNYHHHQSNIQHAQNQNSGAASMASTGGDASAPARNTTTQRHTKECQTDTSIDDVLRMEVARNNQMSVQIEELKVEILNLKDVVIDRDEEIEVLKISKRDADYLRNENEELEIELGEKEAKIDTDQKAIKTLEERIANFDAELAGALAAKDATLGEKDAQQQELQREITSLNDTIEQLHADAKAQQEHSEELESRILDLNIKIESFRNVMTQKDRQLDAVINRRRDAQNFKDRTLLMVIEEKKEEIGKLNLKVVIVCVVNYSVITTP